MVGEDEFRVIPYFERYKINKEGVVKDSKNNKFKDKKKIGRSKGEFYKLKTNDRWKDVRPYLLLLLAYNPYRIDRIENYFKLRNSDIEYIDGNTSNCELVNMCIKEESKYLLEKERESVWDSDSEYVDEFWDYSKNKDENVGVGDVTYGSSKKVWWKCERGHSYKDSVNNRIRSKGCKLCKKFNRISEPQHIMYDIFKINFDKVELEKTVGKYRVDIYIKDINLAVEYDGSAWHKSEERVIKDVEKEKEIKRVLGSKIVRVREEGCRKISTDSEIYNFKNEYNGNYTKLKNITYRIIMGSKEGEVKIKEGNEESKMNKLWYSKENSLIKNFPHLRKYFSNKNNVLFEDLTYGSHYKIKWQCYKCGFYWEQYVNKICKLRNGKYCPRCEKSVGCGSIYHNFKELSVNKGSYIKIKDKNKGNKKGLKNKNRVKEKIVKENIDYKDKNKKTCKVCTDKIKNKNKNFCSVKCYEKHRRKEIPTKNELIRVLTEDPSFMSVGRKYGVSDNAVRKWCDKYNIPRRTKYWEIMSKKVKG